MSHDALCENAPNEPNRGGEGAGGWSIGANKRKFGVVRIEAKRVITHSSAGRVFRFAIFDRGSVESILPSLGWRETSV